MATFILELEDGEHLQNEPGFHQDSTITVQPQEIISPSGDYFDFSVCHQIRIKTLIFHSFLFSRFMHSLYIYMYVYIYIKEVKRKKEIKKEENGRKETNKIKMV